MLDKKSKVDTKEFEFPETVYIRDIENQVFQGIVLQTLAEIKGITLIEGNFLDTILGRESLEGIKGIHAEQDSKSQSVSIRIELNVCFGVSIPEKAQEIQEKIDLEITRLTGLHVSCVHVIFKNIVHSDINQKLIHAEPPAADVKFEEEYNGHY